MIHTLRHTFYYPSRSTTFTIWPLGDIHIGHAACDLPALRRDVQRIAADPYSYWIGMGDYVDAIARKVDRRYAETTLHPRLHGQPDPVQQEYLWFLEEIKPIAHKCLGLLLGNHEDEIYQKTDRLVYLEIARGISKMAGREITQLALGYEGFIVIKFRRGTPDAYGGSRTVTFYAHHGAGGGRKQGGHALRLEETVLTYECDIALVGHRHQQQVVTKSIVAPKGKGSVLRKRIGVMCGAYLKSTIDWKDFPISQYSQRKQLPPMKTGVVPVMIKPDVPTYWPVVVNGELHHALPDVEVA